LVADLRFNECFFPQSAGDPRKLPLIGEVWLGHTINAPGNGGVRGIERVGIEGDLVLFLRSGVAWLELKYGTLRRRELRVGEYGYEGEGEQHQKGPHTSTA
jgi:hypothetical protein